MVDPPYWLDIPSYAWYTFFRKRGQCAWNPNLVILTLK